MTKSILSLILSGLLWFNPVWAQTNSEVRLNNFYIETKDLTYKRVLEIALNEAKSEKERNEFRKGMAILEKNPALGATSVSESVNSLAYFFLNNLEKDFIGYPRSYEFYKGFRDVFRGQKFQYYNAKCVYTRSNATPFNMLDFLNGKFPCGSPINYPRGVSKHKVIEGIEKSLEQLEKRRVTINYYETGKSFGQIALSFFFPEAYAKMDSGKASGIAIGLLALGVVSIMVGVFATPIAAIGIPILALGCVSLAVGIGMITGYSVKDRIMKKRNPPQQ
ncbi:MAG: hypothetical protein ACHQYQ_02690 [Bacteriovoracales bacterium]